MIRFHANYLAKGDAAQHNWDFFNLFDVDRNGLISKTEFKSDMKKVEVGLDINFDEEDINVLFDPSVNKDQYISYDETAKLINCFGKCKGGNMVTLALLLL